MFLIQHPATSTLLDRHSSVVSSVRLAVVPNQLEPANHLADGEEAEQLGHEHTASRELHPRHVPDLLGVGGLQEVREEGAGRLQLLPEVLEVGLEGRNGTVAREATNMSTTAPVIDNKQSARHMHPFGCDGVGGRGAGLRRVHALALDDELGHLEADLGVVDDKRSLACIGGRRTTVSHWRHETSNSQAHPS